MSLVGDRSIMVVIFDDRTTIGMVRLYAKEAAAELAKIFVSLQNRPEEEQPGIDNEFASSAGERLDDIFQD